MLLVGSVLILFLILKMESFSLTILNTVNTQTPNPSGNIESIEIQTGMDPTFAVIWLHGLGADGHDFEPIVPELGLPEEIAVRFIFPHAPERPITVNGGMVMRGWYDISDLPVSMDGSRKEDRAGLEDSTQIVMQLIAQENRRGIPTSRIVLAGFSQGGAIALFAGLRMRQELAGIIALSTYLPDSGSTEDERSEVSLKSPIFMGHGTEDPLIPVQFGKQSEQILTGLGYNVSWNNYPMPHSVHPREIADIGAFLKGIMAEN